MESAETANAGASLLQRSKSLPQVIHNARRQQRLLQRQKHEVVANDGDSGVSFNCYSSLAAREARAAEAGHRPIVAADPQSSSSTSASSVVAEEVAVVKRLVITQIDKKLKDLRTLKQHYYPEGGWGYVIVLVTFLANAVAHGAQMSVAVYLNSLLVLSTTTVERSAAAEDEMSLVVLMRSRGRSVSVSSALANSAVARRLLLGMEHHASWLGALSACVSLLASPLTIGMCNRKSTRLTAVMGGLVAALGFLFTSFAGQFHQLFLSYGILVGLGVGMVRDPATLMVGQYFKRKRELVEIILVSSSGIGIAVMSVFFQISIGSIGWRLGLQAVTGVVFLLFILGTFYRSASLYHPQRRAILHLKSQKRKIKSKDKEKNKAQDDRPPYFDFTTLKSRTVQILLCSVAVGSLGLSTPIFFMAQQAYFEGIQGRSLLLLQAYLGSAWALGCCIFGAVVLVNSRECRISKQYLCQASLFMAGVTILAFTAVEGFNGYVMFVWVYGIFCGGYHYVLKMYLYEKVRARNFARAWGFAQCAMSIPTLIGVPLAGYLNYGVSRRCGYYLSAAAVISGSLVMSLIEAHRRKLRKKNREKKAHVGHLKSHGSTKSGVSAHTASSIVPRASGGAMADVVVSTRNSLDDHAMARSRNGSVGAEAGIALADLEEVDVDDLTRKLTVDDRDDLLMLSPPFSLLAGQRSFTFEDYVDFRNRRMAMFEVAAAGAETSIFTEEEGIADMDLPDELLMEELDFLDNITSCNKVENCVMLSEYEQNLLINDAPHHMEKAVGARRRSLRRWQSLFRQQSNIRAEALPDLAEGDLEQDEAAASAASLNGHEVSVFRNGEGPPKRAITVIEEASV